MTADHVGMSVSISLSGLIRRKNRQCVRVWQRLKAERCCSITCVCRDDIRGEEGACWGRGGEAWRQKEKAENVTEIPGQSHACFSR